MCKKHRSTRICVKMKMAAEVRWFNVIFLFFIFTQIYAVDIHKKFEYKYSFKRPYLAQKNGMVPFWEHGGDAIPSPDFVRLAPSLRSKKGAIWTKNPVNFDWWEVNIRFNVHGAGRIGADGFAFWYTANKGDYHGTVFGSSDKWNGLGIFFDSFDNDNNHNNPYIMAVQNDGTMEFDHSKDGAGQVLAGSLRDFRNKPQPCTARVIYRNNTLTMYYHGGMSTNPQDEEMLFHIENLFLPRGGYFGLSAATGGLADDHDIIHFLTDSLHPVGQVRIDGQTISLEEQEKINLEYLEYQKKLDQQKEDYKKEHPEDMRPDADMEDWYESTSQRELRQIYEGQSQIFQILRQFSPRFDELVGRLERVTSLIAQMGSTGQVPAIPGGQPSQPMALDGLYANQNLIINSVREVKSIVSDVHTKSDTIVKNQARAPTAQVQPMGYDYQSVVSELRDSMNQIKRELASVYAKVDGGAPKIGCPTTNCLTTTTFIVFLVVQIIILIGYSIYKDNRDAQAKKFY